MVVELRFYSLEGAEFERPRMGARAPQAESGASAKLQANSPREANKLANANNTKLATPKKGSPHTPYPDQAGRSRPSDAE